MQQHQHAVQQPATARWRWQPPHAVTPPNRRRPPPTSSQTACRVARPAGTGSPSPDDAGRQPAGDAAAAAAAAAATTARARQELLQSWALLKDAAAGAAPATYLQEAAAAERRQQQQQLSLPDRLKRLLSGEFIRERVAAERGQQQQQQAEEEQVDPRLAAVQFELQQATGYQQPPRVTLEPPAAAPQQAGQQNRQSSGAGPSSTPAAGADSEAARPFYPASTQVLLAAMWGVFALQWAPVLPDLWAAVTSGSVLQPAAAVLLMFPDTPVTHGLCLDTSLLQQGQGWWRLFGAGLCNSGLAATWLCCAALQNCGRLLEAGTGQVELLTMFLLCSSCTCAAHVLAGRCVLCVAAPGTVLGLYTAWTILAARHLRDDVPMRTIYAQGGLLLGPLLALGLLQPAVGVASLAGGMLGGVLSASRVAGYLAVALRWCLAIPAVGGLLVLRLGFDLLKVVWLGCVFAAASAYQLVMDAVKTVRRL